MGNRSETFNKEIKNIKKEYKLILEVKAARTEMKISVVGLTAELMKPKKKPMNWKRCHLKLPSQRSPIKSEK